MIAEGISRDIPAVEGVMVERLEDRAFTIPMQGRRRIQGRR